MKRTLSFFFFSLLIAFPAFANLFNSQPKFLPSEQAFVFAYQQQANQLHLNWQIAEGYYLYKKELRLSSNDAKLGDVPFPIAERHQDEFFGEVEIYRHQLDIPVSVAGQGQVTVRYQGCTKGFCYPPEEVHIDLTQAVSSSSNVAKKSDNLTASPVNTPVSEQNQLATRLAQGNFSLFWFFILGLGLAFTPCVLPMLPLLSAIVIGRQQRPNSLRAFLLSLSYVQGMALTYTLLGLLVAAIGLPFQVALQSPPVLIGLSLLFILLAMSMFGVFTLQLPHRWQQKLNQLSQQQQGGSFFSVFVMGMIAGLVASPCTSAPLSAVLLYVAQSGDLVKGGFVLYLLALGMGIPLILITLFGNRILPKSGDWLLKVKTLFGFVMLALPIFLLSRVLPSFVEPLLWSALAIALLIWLNEQCNQLMGWKKLLRLIVLAGLVLASKPWLDLAFQANAVQQPQHRFTQVRSLAELDQQLTASKGKKVMLDLYADWCVACKEFEKYTFSDPSVQAKFAEMAILQIDMTHNSPENDELMKHFHILGLPTILFFDEQGKELAQARVTGFLPADKFLHWLNGLTQ